MRPREDFENRKTIWVSRIDGVILTENDENMLIRSNIIKIITEKGKKKERKKKHEERRYNE